MAKKPKPIPTKVEIVRWLKKQLAAGKHVDVYDEPKGTDPIGGVIKDVYFR